MPTSPNLLAGSRVYLSGPMDFVNSREREKASGWRAQLGGYLEHLGCRVFDPWNKPRVRGLHEYGREDAISDRARRDWTFADGEDGARARAACARGFRETVHIDLRMVDICDFVIAYVPTNVYSVGTPHEIIVARNQKKPVLFVSPPVPMKGLEALRAHLESDPEGSELLQTLIEEVPIRRNESGLPSLWYMPIVGLEHFFDGFGFDDPEFRRVVPDGPTENRPLSRPLIPYLASLAAGNPPKTWDAEAGRWRPDDDWLILDSTLHDET